MLTNGAPAFSDSNNFVPQKTWFPTTSPPRKSLIHTAHLFSAWTASTRRRPSGRSDALILIPSYTVLKPSKSESGDNSALTRLGENAAGVNPPEAAGGDSILRSLRSQSIR